MMGGVGAHEFLAPCADGEDEIAMCSGCGYAANVEIAQGVPVAPAFPAAGVEEVATPNVRTIAEVSAFLKIDPRLTIKSLLYVGQRSGPVLALVRGDHALHERKLARALQGDEVRRPAPGDPPAPGGGGQLSGTRRCARAGLADEHLRDGVAVVGPTRRAPTCAGSCPDGISKPVSWICTRSPPAGVRTLWRPLGVERSSRSATSSSSAPSSRWRSTPSISTSRARSSPS
jgi:prolyl-tRNA synthetase